MTIRDGDRELAARAFAKEPRARVTQGDIVGCLFVRRLSRGGAAHAWGGVKVGVWMWMCDEEL